ncbi:phosphate ABC transporter periplasmic phosphate-binding protein PstS [Vibrio ponticus]|nr:phosphate ABC transporter periplasmic phosphate-binding protein PstS [Vibrio ponticus]
MKAAIALAVTALLTSVVVSSASAQEQFRHYSKVPGISGELTSVGSDTLAGMTTLWVEEFKQLYPGVNGQVQASGSSTAPPALTEQTAQFGPMSRPMRNSEIEAFERAHGYKPTALRVAIDAIGIFVHQDNPVKGLTLPSSTVSSLRRCVVAPINRLTLGKIWV